MHALSYLSENEVIELNNRVIGLFGGAAGVRDAGALESCVAQPQTAVFGQERFPALFDKAAAYCFFIVRLHPFFDGNKRTGLVAAITFLLDNGVSPDFDGNEMFEAIHGITRGQIEIDDLASILEKSAKQD